MLPARDTYFLLLLIYKTVFCVASEGRGTRVQNIQIIVTAEICKSDRALQYQRLCSEDTRTSSKIKINEILLSSLSVFGSFNLSLLFVGCNVYGL